jgi:hypothetical protein
LGKLQILTLAGVGLSDLLNFFCANKRKEMQPGPGTKKKTIVIYYSPVTGSPQTQKNNNNNKLFNISRILVIKCLL